MTDPLSIFIRPLILSDEPILWEMLYQALYVPKGADPFPRDLVKRPEISRYAQDWGNCDDLGFVALDELDGKPIGAAWVRLLKGENKGYGYVDDLTPELSVAVAPEARGCGVGTRLLVHLLSEVLPKYRAVSLSVSSENPAVQLYQRLGFEVVGTSGNSLTMIKLCLAHVRSLEQENAECKVQR